MPFGISERANHRQISDLQGCQGQADFVFGVAGLATTGPRNYPSHSRHILLMRADSRLPARSQPYSGCWPQGPGSAEARRGTLCILGDRWGSILRHSLLFSSSAPKSLPRKALYFGTFGIWAQLCSHHAGG